MQQEVSSWRHGTSYRRESSLSESKPPLPPVNWDALGAQAPKKITGNDWDPNTWKNKVDMVIITWTEAEWAAFAHVFWDSGEPMPYVYYEHETWRDGWQYYSTGWSHIKNELPHTAPSLTHQAWGSCCIVEFPSNNKTALLFKSDMHISTDGPALPLRNMVKQLIADFGPSLILTIGTAGGARPKDCLGTANITNAGRFDLSGEFDPCHYPFNHETFTSTWKPDMSLVSRLAGSSLLMTTPVSFDELESLRESNKKELTDPATGKPYSLDALVNRQITPGDIAPKINDLPPTPVFTTNGYQVGTTSGNYDYFAAMEMDDAAVVMECNDASVSCGVVRNISDPVQNADLNTSVQGQWGSIIYGEYGFYTSFNGALAAWAVAAAE